MFAMEYKRIGLNILYHRRSKGWTQEMLANKSVYQGQEYLT